MKHEEFMLEFERITSSIDATRLTIIGMYPALMAEFEKPDEEDISDDFIRKIKFILGSFSRVLHEVDILLDLVEEPDDYRLLCKLLEDTKEERDRINNILHMIEMEELGS